MFKGLRPATLMLLFIALALVVAACGSNNGADNAASGSPAVSPSAAATAAQPSSPSPAPSEPVTLEYATNASGGTLNAIKAIAASFNAANGQNITVEVADLGKDFNTQMTARMANNDLPDLFSTGGWAVRRFGEYELPLNDRPWAAQLKNEIKSVVTDTAGNIVALPMDIDISGMVYNNALLQQLGIAVPETWEQFLAACEAIKKAGKTPVGIAGKDSGDVAGLIGRVALSLLIQSANSEKEAFKAGSFDWNKYAAVTDFVANLKSKGYLNADYLTADKPAVYAEFAKDNVAFAFQSNQTIAEVKKLNPNSDMSMMRIPVSDTTTQPFLISGERDSIGIWKDTKHPEAARAFVDYMARSENVKAIAETYSIPTALNGSEADLGDLQAAFNKFQDASVSNHFDREYLPNGMYSVIGTTSQGFLSDTMDAAAVIKTMSDEFARLTKNG